MKFREDAPNVNKFPNLYYWYMNLVCFKPEAIKGWETAHKKDDNDDDDFDVFGDVDEEELKAVKEKQTAAMQKKKKELVAKSIVAIHVKPWGEEQNLEELAAKIQAINLDGCIWFKDFKLIPVAFGIKKLEIACIIEDEKVSTDDFIEIIESWEDDVQSVDIASFQKN